MASVKRRSYNSEASEVSPLFEIASYFPSRGGVVFHGSVAHVRKLRQNIAQIFIGVDPELPAGFQQGVVDRAGLSDIGTIEEEPVLFPDGGGSNGIFDEVVVDLHFGVIRVDE